MSSLGRALLQLQSGAQIVLQRVNRSTDVPLAIEAVRAAGIPASVDTLLLPSDESSLPGLVRVVDGRRLTPALWEAADTSRLLLTRPGRRTLVLLDANSGRVALRHAPHLCSWAGGVGLPAEANVRPASTPEELAMGERLFRRLCEEDPAKFRGHAGASIGVDLASERIFIPTADRSALQAAREELDEGILYLERVAP